jgi:hypothetical protein
MKLSRRLFMRAAAAGGLSAAPSLLYRNPLASDAGLRPFRLEGKAKLSFPSGKLRMENETDSVLWCPQNFPDGIQITWEFRPVREPGLCIFFFAATGIGNKDLFDASLPVRTGDYPQYHSGAINTLHISYFRRRYPEERAFHLCNLRKSKGFRLVAQAADPIPNVEDVQALYRMKVLKDGPRVAFYINELPLIDWRDDGPILTGGKIGFRQMAPLVGEYANLEVRSI